MDTRTPPLNTSCKVRQRRNLGEKGLSPKVYFVEADLGYFYIRYRLIDRKKISIPIIPTTYQACQKYTKAKKPTSVSIDRTRYLNPGTIRLSIHTPTAANSKGCKVGTAYTAGISFTSLPSRTLKADDWLLSFTFALCLRSSSTVDAPCNKSIDDVYCTVRWRTH